jgi:hypothetical protein
MTPNLNPPREATMDNPESLSETLPPLEAGPDLEPEAKTSPLRRRKRGRPGRAHSTSSSAASSPRRPPSSAGAGWERELYDGYSASLVAVGAITMLAMPVTGTVMVNRAPTAADALLKIARRDERIRTALLMVLRYSAFAELGMFIGALGIAASVDAKRIPPDSRIASILIRKEIAEVYGQSTERPAPTPDNGSVPWRQSEASTPAPDLGSLPRVP